MFSSQYQQCPECGMTVVPSEGDTHVCDPARRVEHQMSTLRQEIASFEIELRQFLDGKEGRFEAWVAAREVRRTV